MQKPNGYDETQELGTYEAPAEGGHYAIIKQVAERESSTEKQMVVVLFDFDKNDKQTDYFRKKFEADDREERKWPFDGTKYVMVNDYQDASKTSRPFKTFCSNCEKSNPGFAINWNAAEWGRQFVGKKIGVIFGQEESEYNGETRMRTVPKSFISVKDVLTAKVPAPKLLNGKTTAAKQDNSFMSVPDTAADEIPF